MKTIKERAIEYDAICRFCDNGLAFIAGAKSEHEELTRWNDPKEPPKDDKQVLVKTGAQLYDIAYYDRGFNRWFTGNGTYDSSEIIGWREIHE